MLTKALQLVQGLGLNEREIRYLLTHAADFGNLDLSELPTATVGDYACGDSCHGTTLRPDSCAWLPMRGSSATWLAGQTI